MGGAAIMDNGSRIDELERTGERGPRWLNAAFKTTAAAVLLWISQFVFPSISLLYMNVLIITAVTGAVAVVVSLAGLAMPALRAQHQSGFLVCAVASLLAAVYSIMSMMEIDRAVKIASCTLSLQEQIQAIVDYQRENQNRLPTSHDEIPYVKPVPRCNAGRSKYILNTVNPQYPPEVLAYDSGPVHDPYWFSFLMRSFRQSEAETAAGVETESRVDRLVHKQFGSAECGIAAGMRDGSVQRIPPDQPFLDASALSKNSGDASPESAGVDPTDAEQVARAFLAAIAARDVETALHYIVPGERARAREEFTNGELPSIPPNPQFNMETRSPDTLMATVTNAGPDSDLGLDMIRQDGKWWVRR